MGLLFLAIILIIAGLILLVQKTYPKGIALAVFAAAVVCVVLSGVRIVPPGHVGVQILFGKVQPRALNEGLNLVNPLVMVKEMSIRTETYVMSSKRGIGKVVGDDSIQVQTKDRLSLPLDVTVAYRLEPQSAPAIYRNIGSDYEKVLRAAARTSIRDAAKELTADEACISKREYLASSAEDLMIKRIQSILKDYPDIKGKGFIVQQILLQNISLPANLRKRIEEKLEKEQEALQMQFTLEKERKEAERKAIEAKGIADFQKIVAEGISDKLLQWKGIEATLKIAESRNAKVVIIGSGKNGLPVILNVDKK